MRLSAAISLVLLLQLLAARIISAQTISSAVAFGIAAPGASMGQFRGPGPTARIGVTFGSLERHLRLRLDLQKTLIPDNGGVPSPGWRDGDFHDVGALTTLLFGGANDRRQTLYGMLGPSLHWAWIDDAVNPYGTVLGLQLGVGASAPVRRVRLFGEIMAQPLISDFGAESETAAVYTTLVVGIAFE